ncbi:MAG: sigma 54-interacting transcriptional regulator [Deltaproteobacteria bacterium]|nr:sigma 54-interacting transcriptional regulator [Deltaproteobacteria bacterium]
MALFIDDSDIRTDASFITVLDKDKLLKGIFKISAFLTSPSKVDEILNKILDVVVDTICFHQGSIRLLDDTKQFLVTKAVKNYGPEEAELAFTVDFNLIEHDCIATKVAKSGEHIFIEDASTDPRITETDRLITRIYDRGSIYCAPLKIGNDIIGIIAAWCNEQTRFFPEEIELFSAFANQISTVIHNIRLFENNSEKIRQLTILQEAVSEMNMGYGLDNRIIDIVIRTARQIVDADRIMIYFCDIENDRCLIGDGDKVLEDDKKAWDKTIGQTIIKKAIDTHKIMIHSPLRKDNQLKPLFFDYQSELAVPMLIKDRFKGALYLAKKTGTYSQENVNLLDILVKNASTSYDNAIMHSMLSLEAKSLKTEVEKLKEREDVLLGFHNILGKSKKMLELFQVIEEVAGHNTNILITGESGTGKELIARAIHRQSNRSAKPFVDVNCAAIPGTLLESELFGYEAGAFTDARKRKIGLLEHANGGTILLDEIGDMDIHLQAKFLRVLEDGYIRRLGGTENIPIDVRFIFSTNKDIKKMSFEGSFREDLFYRISVVPIHIPPLRERPDDILLLARYYVEEFNKKFSKKVIGFAREAEEKLVQYQWPGNVRELKNIIERVMILQNISTLITRENLSIDVKPIIAAEKEMENIQIDDLLPQISSSGINYEYVTDKIMNDVKSKILQKSLEISGGNKSKAAGLLGISRYKFIRENNKTNINKR